MFQQSKIDRRVENVNSSILSPSLKHNSSFNNMLHHSKNNSPVTPTRSFKRYSLADTKFLSDKLKNDESYKSHINAKIDSKSPGYSRRVVQYSAEQERSLPTHNNKYDKLGVFPIVHLFKKELPHLKRKTCENSGQLNSLELSKYNSPEHNRMLLEKIIKSSPVKDISHKKETNTKSVLDALKEISRKRIQSNEEEFVIKDDGKRMHVNYDSDGSRKRLKQNSSQMDDSSISLNSSSDRFSVLNELTASQSSMDGILDEVPKKKHNKSHNRRTSVKSIFPVKHVDVETQTSTSQVRTITQATLTDENIEIEPAGKIKNAVDVKPKKNSPVKIFDETPLETMRRKRLSALMGQVMANKTPNKENPEEMKNEKPLVSILAGSTKSPNKSNKHVTFNLPESTTTSSGSQNNEIYSSAQNISSGANTLTKTSTAIVAPIVSASVNELPPTVPKTLQTEVTTNNDQNQGVSTPPTFSFASQTPSNNVSLPPSTVTQTNPTFTRPNWENKESPFKQQKESPNVSFSVTSATQPGGFKFELKQPKTSTAATSAPFLFTSSPSTNSSLSTSTSNPILISSSAIGVSTISNNTTQVSASLMKSKDTSPAFSFMSGQASTPNQKKPTAFGDSTKNQSLPMFAFSNNQINNANSNVPSNFPVISVALTSTSTQSVTTSTPTFRSNVAVPNLSSSSSSRASPVFNFGSNNTNTMVQSSTTFSNASVSFAPLSTYTSVSKSSSIFPIVSSAPHTLNATNSNNVQQDNPFAMPGTPLFNKPADGFNSIASSVPSAFPAPANKTPANNFSFGSSNPVLSTNPSGFGANKSTSFGDTSGSKSVFGQGAPPSFGTATTSASTVAFGNTSNNVFGNPGGFGSPCPSSFGTNAMSNFGSSNNFGPNQSSPFSTPPTGDVKPNNGPFGAPSNSPFVVATSSSTFGISKPTFSTASGFSSVGSFGQPSNNSFATGFNTVSSFDKSSNQLEANQFGNTAPSFGSNSFQSNQSDGKNVFNFGGNNNAKPPVFSFGASEAPKPFSFGTDNSNAFGVNSKQPFGNTAPAFNSPVPNQFGVQPVGGAMFNIGTGGSATPTRSRVPHKTKRRT